MAPRAEKQSAGRVKVLLLVAAAIDTFMRQVDNLLVPPDYQRPDRLLLGFSGLLNSLIQE